MPPKAALTTIPLGAITLRKENTSIEDNSQLQVVTIAQLQKVVDQLIGNGAALKAKINNIGLM